MDNAQENKANVYNFILIYSLKPCSYKFKALVYFEIQMSCSLITKRH